MAKILKALFSEKCIGCELCVIEVQRQLNKIGIEDSLIRIFKKYDDIKKESRYEVFLDPRVQETDLERIVKICPTGVFTVEESEGEDDLT